MQYFHSVCFIITDMVVNKQMEACWNTASPCDFGVCVCNRTWKTEIYLSFTFQDDACMYCLTINTSYLLPPLNSNSNNEFVCQEFNLCESANSRKESNGLCGRMLVEPWGIVIIIWHYMLYEWDNGLKNTEGSIVILLKSLLLLKWSSEVLCQQ